ncbi:MAG: ABC-type transport auxiliary lipoprotein family protein [bacterium]|nr:ABC-type transport auxiliary lipoprotein family protein [bacterium]
MRFILKSKVRMSLLFFLISLTYFSCTTRSIQREYYLLDYRPILRDSTLTVQQPFPYKVHVQTMKIPRTFDRVGIVVRYSTHQLDYYRYKLWAIRPQIIISDLIARHISNYQIFQSCQREFLDERPDYEIIGVIDAIEIFDSQAYTAAHLAMKLYLRSHDGYDILMSHEFDREEEMPVFRMELFAKKISDIVREEVDVFIKKLIPFFEKQQQSAADQQM